MCEGPPPTTLVRGVKMDVFRGGALDIGFCHEEPNRSSFTFEVWYFVPPSDEWKEKAATGGSGVQNVDDDDDVDDEGESKPAPLPFRSPQTLAVRSLCLAEDEKSFDMWSLRLQPSGSLVFQLIDQNDTATSQPFSSEALNSHRNKKDGASSYFATNAGVISAGKWHHIALTLTSKRYLAWDPENPSRPQTCDVSIIVDGEKVQTEVYILFFPYFFIISVSDFNFCRRKETRS